MHCLSGFVIRKKCGQVMSVKSIMVCIAVTSMVNARGCKDQEDRNVPNNNNNPLPPGNIKKLNLIEAPPPKPRNRCCPYDFDSSLCKIIDDRVLCGYNRNVGWPESKNKAVDVADGCRWRGSRLECGYVHGPYTNPRRPPVWYNYGSREEDKENVIDHIEDNTVNIEKEPLKRVVRPKPTEKRCVEIKDRIVC